MKNFLNEEYEDVMELINGIRDKKKKEMVLFYFKKMVRDETPEDIAYDNIKELIEKGIEALVQRTQFDNVEREDEEDDDDLEDPKDIIKSIKNQELRKFAKFYYDNMKKDRAPKSAIVDMMQDIKDESFFGIPDELRTKKEKNKSDKQEKSNKKEKFRTNVNMILQGIKGYKASPDKKKEENLYKDFGSIKEEKLFEEFMKTLLRKKPF